jgi:hypothetical protein
MGNSDHRRWFVWLPALLLAVATPAAAASDRLASLKAQLLYANQLGAERQTNWTLPPIILGSGT